ncbi:MULTISPECIES: AraC family transcriptional regulator [Clostridia]|jgi:AraC-like DNA-binding protein|uniref:AraC family transcriptional regulator n=1 Tax=Clostridia TaxID=186801 RepID=UPI00051AE71F|nr:MULTISPECIES: AraC family transcriptional regulator [Clostridia]WOO35975.1 AraC family transcriptional regulator [Anaerocolumna sp. AGMB13020]
MCQHQFDITYYDLNPTILFVSKQKMVKESSYHEHDFTELTYILSGKGKYLVEGTVYDVEAGDVIMCNPGVKHQNILVNPKEPTVEFFAGFTGFQFKNMPPNSLIFKDGGHILHTSSETKQDISKHCYEMISENESCKAGKYFMLKAHMIQIMLHIIRDITEAATSQKGLNFESYNKSYAVKKIINYLNENYETKISLDQIAHNMYLSPVYISKIFKEETGESPINYLIKIRLEKARDILLSSEGESIKSIANRVGYEDVYHFSKLFKKYYGISPLYYKRYAMEKLRGESEEMSCPN